eukprot:9491889-Pyramimonas_sp.AAC.2
MRFRPRSAAQNRWAVPHPRDSILRGDRVLVAELLGPVFRRPRCREQCPTCRDEHHLVHPVAHGHK